MADDAMMTPERDPAMPARRRDRGVLRLFLLVTLITCALGWYFKGHCSLDGRWDGDEQYVTGCYSDADPFWSGRAIDQGKIPYFEGRMEYPVLTGALIHVDGRLTRLIFGRTAIAANFTFAVTLVNTLLALLVTWLMWRIGVPRQRLWWWAAAPPLILYVGHNWDMLAVAFVTAAVLMARRSRIVAAAALAALGVAAKLYPIWLLPLLSLKDLVERRWRRFGLIVAAAVGAWALVNLPVAAAAFENWSEFYRFSGDRTGTAAALWELLGQLGWLNTDVDTRNKLSAMFFLAGYLMIVRIGWARHRDHLWVLFTPVLAWFLLMNKVYSPQFDLWLYPMMVLTSRRRAPIALFIIGDIAAYFAEFWSFANLDGAPAIAVAAAIRAAAMLWIIGSAVREPAPRWLTGAASEETPAAAPAAA